MADVIMIYILGGVRKRWQNQSVSIIWNVRDSVIGFGRLSDMCSFFVNTDVFEWLIFLFTFLLIKSLSFQ